MLVERHGRVAFAEQHGARRDLAIELTLIFDQRAAEIIVPEFGIAEWKQIVGRLTERTGDSQSPAAVWAGGPILPCFVIARPLVQVVIIDLVIRELFVRRLIGICHG